MSAPLRWTEAMASRERTAPLGAAPPLKPKGNNGSWPAAKAPRSRDDQRSIDQLSAEIGVAEDAVRRIELLAFDARRRLDEMRRRAPGGGAS